MSAETWRVVCEGGEVREVTATKLVGRWRAEHGDDGEEGDTARDAVVWRASAHNWPVVEIVAPGAQTSEEQLAQVTAERDAAVAARDALAGAVREEREAKERAGIEHNALVDANDYAERRLYGWETRLRVVSERHRKAVDARIAATDRITALVDAALTATPVAMVRAEVVRAYRAAEETMALVIADDHRRDTYHEWAKRHGAAMDAVDAARTALDAALAAAGGV